MDCFESVARLHLYIGRELSVEEVAVVQQHVKACPNCGCRFHFDVSVMQLIHERCTIEKAHAHLREVFFFKQKTAYEIEETEDAIGDHNDIRDGITEAARYPVGSEGW